MSVLTFDEARHEYRIDGAHVLSVTQILRLSGHIQSRWFTDFARMRGTYVHSAIELDIKGDLNEDTLHTDLRPYVEGWRRWAAQHGVEIVRGEDGQPCTELRLGSETYRVAGTIDVLARMNKQIAIIDFKTGVPYPYHRLQTAAYALLAEHVAQVPPSRIQRIGLYLSSDGQARHVPFTDRQDLKVWDACRVNAQWRWAQDQATCERELNEDSTAPAAQGEAA